MAFTFAPLFQSAEELSANEKPQRYDEMKGETGFVVTYERKPDGRIVVTVAGDSAPIEASFPGTALDEARILYMEVTELLRTRVKLFKQDKATIRRAVEELFAAFRGEKVTHEAPPAAAKKPEIGKFEPNPGKKLEIDIGGVPYLRLPVKTRLITMQDTDILPLIEEYVRPSIRPGDIVFVSEKALTITQGRIVDMSDIKTTRFARFLARNVGNYYGSDDFRGFGHGTDMAMQLFIEEAGYPRVIFAALVSALTRPFGVRGLFYALCGTRAKSIDCPMSFLILEYAHAAKLAPHDSSGAARRIKKALDGTETVILDANYRGAFSLGKSSRAITESFVQEAFRDNPLGQSDEMTPFCILRKAA